MRAQSRVGTSLRGKYHIERLLGVGGMAAVFEAVHRNGRRVAVKLLHPQFSFSAEFRERFLREGRAANAVTHPGVVSVIDDDVTEDGGAFLVMELLDGQSVEEVWEDHGRRLQPKVVLALGRELCDVLSAAHQAGVVHRDIKPANLFLARGGQLKVLDFGLAQLQDSNRLKATATGLVFGTPAFMAPEQAAGRTSRIDPQTDVWAVGATLFVLLAGVTVHEGESAQHIVVRAATEPARSLLDVLPDAPGALVDVVDRALAYKRRARWTSAREMRDAICAACDELFGDPLVELPDPGDLTRVRQVLVPPRDEHGVHAFRAREAGRSSDTHDAYVTAARQPSPSSDTHDVYVSSAREAGTGSDTTYDAHVSARAIPEEPEAPTSDTHHSALPWRGDSSDTHEDTRPSRGESSDTDDVDAPARAAQGHLDEPGGRPGEAAWSSPPESRPLASPRRVVAALPLGTPRAPDLLSRPRLVGATTSQPISSIPPTANRRVQFAGRTVLTQLGGALRKLVADGSPTRRVAVFCAGLLWLVAIGWSYRWAAAPSQDPAATDTAATAISPTRSSADPSPSVIRPGSGPSAEWASAPPTSGAPPAPPQDSAVAAVAPPRSIPGATALQKPAAPTTAVPGTATTTPRMPDCNPPYAKDASGAKHWKLECL
jgi:serine/threonine-protein kinase